MDMIKFVIKIIVICLYYLSIKLYLRNRKNDFMEKKKKWMDIFYIFYTIGIICMILDIYVLTIFIYLLAMLPLLRSSFTGQFYDLYKEWENQTQVSKFEKICVLLSIGKSDDFEYYRMVKEMEKIKKELGIEEDFITHLIKK